METGAIRLEDIFAEDVRCPKCHSPRLNLGGGSSTLLWCPTFTDDGGKTWHHHNGNRITQGYECRDCGQTWGQDVKQTCWCGWPDSGPYKEG